jgi:hypothetical protein
MGELFTATTVAADAPKVDPGLCDAKFIGVSKKFITGGDFGDGDRFEWAFALMDDDGNPYVEDRPEHPQFGNPIVVNGLTSLSLNTTSRTKPKALRYMSALLSETEYAAWTGGDAALNMDDLIGRTVQVEVFIKDSGWPSISNVLPPRKRRSASRPNEGVSNSGNLPF